jgi:alkanesulfonate monooxygenase SsuD/methylene tetrahydromethanopterin reductase-like flavin-dependent oxidoreductase (luciferase family)
MVAANVIAADTDEEARLIFTSIQQSFVRLRRGAPGKLPPPSSSAEADWTPVERAGVDSALRYAFVGTQNKVRAGIEEFLALTQANELMVTGHIFDHQARLRSFAIAAEVREAMAADRAA